MSLKYKIIYFIMSLNITFIYIFIKAQKMSFNVAINGILMSHKNGFSMLQKIIFLISQNEFF